MGCIIWLPMGTLLTLSASGGHR
uniref:Uncharacterized protein n=1 Tax=Anguilla anguilla TaxID=7936 RepID=A0A0E9RX33_ANGAN